MNILYNKEVSLRQERHLSQQLRIKPSKAHNKGCKQSHKCNSSWSIVLSRSQAGKIENNKKPIKTLMSLSKASADHLRIGFSEYMTGMVLMDIWCQISSQEACLKSYLTWSRIMPNRNFCYHSSFRRMAHIWARKRSSTLVYWMKMLLKASTLTPITR